MNAFDVRIHTIRRRKNKRRPFEVRWRVAGRDRSKSFLTRALGIGEGPRQGRSVTLRQVTRRVPRRPAPPCRSTR